MKRRLEWVAGVSTTSQLVLDGSAWVLRNGPGGVLRIFTEFNCYTTLILIQLCGERRSQFLNKHSIALIENLLLNYII